LKSESFLSRNISGFTSVLELTLVNENLSKNKGLLQGLDPRVKLITFLLFVITIGFARNFWILLFMLALAVGLCLLSEIPLRVFVKRVILFIPIFTLIIAIPALFITPGNPWVQISDKVIITIQGARTAGLLLLRVTDSLSFGILLILTTRWVWILFAFRWWRIPAIVIDILSMTYRYIFVLLHTVNSMFLARRSRTIKGFSRGENRRWLTTALISTLTKSQHLSEEVYLAMVSRGYQGETRVLNDFKIKRQDIFWVAFSLITAALLFWCNAL
jgi:cobalt/nickel transport system permease protein